MSFIVVRFIYVCSEYLKKSQKKKNNKVYKNELQWHGFNFFGI